MAKLRRVSAFMPPGFIALTNFSNCSRVTELTHPVAPPLQAPSTVMTASFGPTLAAVAGISVVPGLPRRGSGVPEDDEFGACAAANGVSAHESTRNLSNCSRMKIDLRRKTAG